MWLQIKWVCENCEGGRYPRTVLRGMEYNAVLWSNFGRHRSIVSLYSLCSIIMVAMQKSKGLTSTEATRRIGQYGYNELVKKEENKELKILLRQIASNPIIYILLFAAVLSYYSDEAINLAVILLIIAYVIGMGFFQERKAEKAMEALKAMVKPECRVLRDGSPTIIPAREVVPGDVLVLEMGDKISADARTFDVMGLRMDEAPLTGESVPVSKTEGDFVFAGTTVVYGKSHAVVEKTGMNTRLGQIANLVQAEEEETPLQKKINRLVKYFAAFTLSLAAVLFLLGLGDPEVHLPELLIITLALAVASVPEGLPLVLTTSLAVGMSKLAEKGAIVRRLSAVETLGSVTVICTDKTGTLTKNEMVVGKVFADCRVFDVAGSGYEPEGHFISGGKMIGADEAGHLRRMMECAVLCNNSAIEKKNGAWRVIGDPTEGALVAMAAKNGVFKKELDDKFPKLIENFFTSERKFMSTVHSVNGKKIAFAKGAPEVIVGRCTHILKGGELIKLTRDDSSKINQVLAAFGEESLRVMAFAYNDSREDVEKGEYESGMVFLGMAGMADPVREEVFPAIEACKRGGIRVIIITGDGQDTARTIGMRVGVISSGSEVLTGAQLDAMDDVAFRNALAKTNVFARTQPEHKLRIVNALREHGEIVAMTGDGVNDAPALKKADIGIAMGIKGTEVTKESSDMVISDDNFATIVHAVQGGRGIFENIQKTTAFILSRNYAEVFLVLIATLLLGFEYVPLVALQILFINIIDEEIPAVVLGLDRPRRGIMNERPKNPREGILPRRLLALIFGLSIFTALAVFLAYSVSRPEEDLQLARTVAFASIIATVVFNAMSFKSLEERLSIRWIFSDRLLVYAIVGSAAAGLAVVYYPPLQVVFETKSLGAEGLAIAVAVGIATTAFLEAGKALLWARGARAGASASQVYKQ